MGSHQALVQGCFNFVLDELPLRDQLFRRELGGDGFDDLLHGRIDDPFFVLQADRLVHLVHPVREQMVVEHDLGRHRLEVLGGAGGPVSDLRMRTSSLMTRSMTGMMKEKPSDRILSSTPWSWLNTTPRSPAPMITKGEKIHRRTSTTARMAKGLIFFSPGTSLNGSNSLFRAMAPPSRHRPIRCCPACRRSRACSGRSNWDRYDRSGPRGRRRSCGRPRVSPRRRSRNTDRRVGTARASG